MIHGVGNTEGHRFTKAMMVSYFNLKSRVENQIFASITLTCALAVGRGGCILAVIMGLSPQL
jgi:hypothetical protein